MRDVVAAQRRRGGAAVFARMVEQWQRLFMPLASLPPEAARERVRDRYAAVRDEPDLERAIDEAVAWIGRAQDQSRSGDGGVARHYSLIDGWSTSYPETTGYIIPTLLDHARSREGEPGCEARGRARRMADWLVSIQMPDGGFQGGMIHETPVVPVTFNTGQILMGLAAAVEEFGEAYLEPMTRAADWLADTQDADGAWRRHPSPFAASGDKTYDTHVARGLLEADRVRPNARHRRAALANIEWALRRQRSNGWLELCCLDHAAAPLTHTLGYALCGVLAAHRATGDARLLRAARRTADGLLGALKPNGFLPGRLNCAWRGRVTWACLTGTAQVAQCWLTLFSLTGDRRYLEAGTLANRYVARTMDLDGPANIRGGVKGSYPVDGGYGRFEYLNWACKFFIDSARLQQAIGETATEPAATGRPW